MGPQQRNNDKQQNIVHHDCVKRCTKPGEGNKGSMEWHMEYHRAVDPDIYQVLLWCAIEVRPEVDPNDYMTCDKFDLMD